MPTRTKRGIINGLGSFIKDITGNLDNRDLIDIQNSFNDVFKNQETLNHQINEQIHFNAQMVRRLEDIQNFTVTNINRLQDEVQKSIRNTNTATLVLLYDQHFYKINHVIEQLNNHLEDLLEIIQSSKNKIISRHLLSVQEYKYIEQIMGNNNIHFPNMNAILNLVTVKGYYNKTNIIFSIEIPQFTQDEFTYYQIKIIPKENKIIYPSNPNDIIISQETFQFVKTPCRNIYNQYFCNKAEIKPISKSCEAAIITQRPANCSFQLVSPTLEIDYLTYGQLYIQPLEPLKYNSTCKQQSMYIKTQTLITFKNCEITIRDETFSTIEKTQQEIRDINLPFNEINIITIKPEITLEKLNNYSITNLSKMELLHNNHLLHSSTGHASLLIITFIITCFIIHRIINRYKQLIKIDHVPVPLNRTCTTLRGEESYPTTKQNTTAKRHKPLTQQLANTSVSSSKQPGMHVVDSNDKDTTTSQHIRRQVASNLECTLLTQMTKTQQLANTSASSSKQPGMHVVDSNDKDTTTQPFKVWETQHQRLTNSSDDV